MKTVIIFGLNDQWVFEVTKGTKGNRWPLLLSSSVRFEAALLMLSVETLFNLRNNRFPHFLLAVEFPCMELFWGHRYLKPK